MLPWKRLDKERRNTWLEFFVRCKIGPLFVLPLFWVEQLQLYLPTRNSSVTLWEVFIFFVWSKLFLYLIHSCLLSAGNLCSFNCLTLINNLVGCMLLAGWLARWLANKVRKRVISLPVCIECEPVFLSHELEKQFLYPFTLDFIFVRLLVLWW